jgi:hypothetical protein
LTDRRGGAGMGYARYLVAAIAGFMTLSTTLAFLGDNLFGASFRFDRGPTS